MVGLPSVWLLEGRRPLQLALSLMIDQDSRDRQIPLEAACPGTPDRVESTFEVLGKHLI